MNIKETEIFLEQLNLDFKGYKNCRGLIGATAAISWSSKNDKTFELITYRQPNKWGAERDVKIDSVIKMDKLTKKTFDNFDYKNNHDRITPSSPCPILYGIRGDNEKELVKALSIVQSESTESWLLFKTNQATDDHLQNVKISNVKPFQSVILKGIVTKNPYTIEGGHVFFSINNNGYDIDCAAYEPTKQFRNIIRQLNLGDEVEVYGGVRNEPLTVNIEKIKIYHLTNIFEKFENPICPKCGKHMKSIGKNQGFKCKKCRTKSNLPTMVEKKRKIHLEFYEVPVCARRHLSKPLKRMDIK